MRGRILGIDPGTRRIGLALSDPLGITAQGLETFDLSGGKDFLEYLSSLIGEYEIGEVVVGLPLSMSGGEIEGTERARELAGRIQERFGIPVVLRDERMTSLEGERYLEARGGKKGDVDRLAAVLILQTYLDEINSEKS